MIVLGLTGSIGMGKTTSAGDFRRLGVPVFDSDAEVHKLLARGGRGVIPVGERFPGAVVNGAIDRQSLGTLVFEDGMALKSLEDILHPLVRAEQNAFLRRCASQHKDIVLYDIPLLYETGAQQRCDAVVETSAPAFVQEQRVLSRAGMNAAKLRGILARQTPDHEKRRMADFVVLTGLGRAYALRQVCNIVRVLKLCRGTVWPPGGRHGGLYCKQGIPDA